MAMHYMPNSYAKHPVFTLMLRALIQTIYRALLTSAVSGIGHRIHTLKIFFAETKLVKSSLKANLGSVYELC